MARKVAIVLLVVFSLYAVAFVLFVRSGPPNTEYFPLSGKPTLVNQTIILIPAKGFQRVFQTSLYFLFWPAGKVDRIFSGKEYARWYEDPDAALGDNDDRCTNR